MIEEKLDSTEIITTVTTKIYTKNCYVDVSFSVDDLVTVNTNQGTGGKIWRIKKFKSLGPGWNTAHVYQVYVAPIWSFDQVITKKSKCKWAAIQACKQLDLLFLGSRYASLQQVIQEQALILSGELST